VLTCSEQEQLSSSRVSLGNSQPDKLEASLASVETIQQKQHRSSRTRDQKQPRSSKTGEQKQPKSSPTSEQKQARNSKTSEQKQNRNTRTGQREITKLDKLNLVDANIVLFYQNLVGYL
jgi:hypothetical protein